MLGGIGGRRRSGRQRTRRLDGITDSMDVSLSELREGNRTSFSLCGGAGGCPRGQRGAVSPRPVGPGLCTAAAKRGRALLMVGVYALLAASASQGSPEVSGQRVGVKRKILEAKDKLTLAISSEKAETSLCRQRSI